MGLLMGLDTSYPSFIIYVSIPSPTQMLVEDWETQMSAKYIQIAILCRHI